MQLNRRNIVKGAVAVIPANIALTMLSTRFAFAQDGDFADDVEILNYALTLEYLESEFYRQGNAAGLLAGKEAMYLQQVGADEDAHVTAITQTIMQLGAMPVAAPGVDFGQAFASRESFLETAYTFENLGVSAYLGAAGFVQDKAILQAAAGIFGVECRHAAILGNLRGLPAEGGVYMGPTETPMTRAEVLAAAQPFLTGAGSMAGGAAVTK
ncbi:MAG: ferritin-like domain-containing protein [Egibacteraceae bacterium]